MINISTLLHMKVLLQPSTL